MKTMKFYSSVGASFLIALGFLQTAQADSEFLKTPEIHFNATGESLEIFNTLNVTDALDQREPASVGKHKVAAKAQKGGASLPKNIVYGFEVRVHYKGVSQTFWIMARGNKYDFAYANSTDSRATPPITAEEFSAFYKSAQAVAPANKVVVSKCPLASIHLFIREPGKNERATAGCADGKDKTSQQLQVLTNWLISRL